MSQQNIIADPHGAYYFALEINGLEIAHFVECSGLKTTSTVFEFQEGGLNGRTHKRAGQSKWDNLVLKYATSASTDLLRLRDQYLQDQFESRTTNSGAIIQYDNRGTEVRRYSFTNAWPVSWEGPSLDSGGSELAIETLELSHDGLFVSDGAPEPEPSSGPPPKPPGAVLTDGKIEVLEPIQFEYDSASISGEQSQQTLDDVAEILKNNPDMRVEVAGHASAEGTDDYNMDLSQRRMDEVARQLEARGVPSEQMVPVGYGESQPVADNSTAEGRAANRRVEFNNI